MNNNKIYTDEELEQLATIKKTRMDIIGSMTVDGVPTRSGDIRVLNEVLTSADKMISDSANTRLKQADSASNGAATEMVIQLLMQAKADKANCRINTNAPNITGEAAVVATVSGETDINPEPLVATDFVAPKFNAHEAEGR